MFFLNLMLNAFSSVIRLTQVTGDTGPSPRAPAVPPPGPAVPIPAAGGVGIANGYPYVAPNAAPFVPGAGIIPVPATTLAAVEGVAGGGGLVAAAPIPAPLPAPVIPAAFAPAPLSFLPPAPAYNPNFGFSNYNLLINNFSTKGATEKWYQAQVAMYLEKYRDNHDPAPPAGTFTYQRERTLPIPIPRCGDVDFYFSKTNLAVNYSGFYELKVQRSNNVNDLADLVYDFQQDMYKVICAAQLANANALINHEYVACLFFIDPRILQLPNAFLLANIQNLSVYDIGTNTLNLRYNNPYQNPAPGYAPVLTQQYVASATIPNYRRRRNNGDFNVDNLPGIVHFFQPYWVAGLGSGSYQFVEVSQINTNIPLLCIYNGS